MSKVEETKSSNDSSNDSSSDSSSDSSNDSSNDSSSDSSSIDINNLCITYHSIPKYKSKQMRKTPSGSEHSEESKQHPIEYITVVDCVNSYTEATHRNYKRLPIDKVIEEFASRTPITNKSRYEILKDKDRRIHFDIEKIPVDKPNMINDIIRNLNDYMKSLKLIENDFKYALTSNSGSITHKGLSYHLILYEYTMNFNVNRNLVISFVHSDYGKDYIEYIDCAIYTKLRLFKLPYYIGMSKDGIDTNADNHHRIIEGEPKDFIIQYTKESKFLTYDFDVKPEWFKEQKRISPIFQQKVSKVVRDVLVKGMKNIGLTNDNKEKKIKTLKFKLGFILENMDKLSKIKQKIVNRIKEVGINKETVDIYEGSINIIYNIIKEELKRNPTDDKTTTTTTTTTKTTTTTTTILKYTIESDEDV